MPTRHSFTTRSEGETEAFGQQLALTLNPGSTVLLHGELGAGKTTLVRGIARGLGIDPSEVSSPTFALIQEYRGRVTLYHVDLYRLDAGPAVDDLGLEELMNHGGIVVVEWADRLSGPMPGAIQVSLKDRGDTVREIIVERE